MADVKVAFTNYVLVKQGSKNLPPLKSVIIPGELTPPEKTLVCLYGSKVTNGALREARYKAKQKKLDLYRIDMKINGGEIPKGKVALENLKNVKFLNIARIGSSLKKTIYDIVSADEVEDLKLEQIIAKKPKTLDLVFNHPDFSHLTAIAWVMPAKPKVHPAYQFAAIRKIEQIENVEPQNPLPTQIKNKISISIDF